MTTHQVVPCSIAIRIGDIELPTAISFTIPVNLYPDDPGANEVDCWKAGEGDRRTLSALPFKLIQSVEQIAMEQALAMQAKDDADRKLSSAETL